MNRIAQFVLAGSIAAALAAPVMAHHSAAAYNTQQELKVTGTVTEYRFKNPHVYMTVQVKKADGSTAPMEVEAGAASVLNPLGFNRDSVKVGDVVTIVGNPARSNADQSMLGKDLFKSDGSYYPLNIASRSIYAPGNETATSIAGTWFPPRTEFNTFLGGARNWSVTEKGKAAMAIVDPKATTQKDCIPIGAPALMFYPVADTIIVQRDRVVMKVDWMDSERIVYLDGRKHPPAGETSLQGHSVGRWEGETLVVETTNFKEHANGLSGSLPSSAQKRLTERFALSPDHKNLIYSGVIEDPVYLAKPVEWSGQWQYRPNMPHSNEKCDLEVARQFLRN
ncbi:MAG TPA: DUF6152 family protein [Terriglobia bacterium]|nr:DUF6152 family protein [Terriglobia bacterium]